MKTVFIVDDDLNTCKLVRQYLRQEGFAVEIFGSVSAVEERLKTGFPDMFVLDIMLPGEDGLAFCRRIRAGNRVPIIFISARGDELDRVLGLDLGGDDYLAKPFSPRELVARVKAVFRRAGTAGEQVPEALAVNDLRIMPGERRVVVSGREVDFTPKEFELLHLLLRNPGRAFSREQLLDAVWGYDYVGDVRAVDDLVKRVRKKLRERGSPVEIATVWGYGYKLSGE
ncbi:response regulator transcription factor [Desulfotomaculum copahuensis]|uniref:response regulator transcription factor n=1 Tax=Desulfotomaculum copahuensis TaxID=1838280 RepID=UPI000AEBBD4E|nr:response regulator transcription factor [Desulfotomaculum copahuensis]